MRGSIQHRPGRPRPWRARYRGVDGRQRSNSFERKIDAERWLRTELASIDRGEWEDPDMRRITWAEYSSQLLDSRAHLGARTLETYRRCREPGLPPIGATEFRSHHSRATSIAHRGPEQRRLRSRNDRKDFALGQVDAQRSRSRSPTLVLSSCRRTAPQASSRRDEDSQPRRGRCRGPSAP